MVVSRDCLHYASLRGPLSTSTGTLSPRSKSGDVIPKGDAMLRDPYPLRGPSAGRYANVGALDADPAQRGCAGRLNFLLRLL